MKVKTLKILTMVATILLVISMGASIVFATPDQIKPDLSKTDNSELNKFGQKIMTAITGVGIVASVVILAVLGLKYMMGSAEEKADYKKSMIPYLVGAIVLFSAPMIANAVYNFVKPEQ